ncbi:MAG: Hsp70 family protein [Thalassobaculales bacterium]
MTGTPRRARAVACSFDFGTSSSCVGLAGDGPPRLIALEAGELTLPSAMFFDEAGGGVVVGRAAVARYVAGHEGRLMRSFKSALATSLIHETTALKSGRVSFQDVIGHYLARLKDAAEAAAGAPLEAGVEGRPVHFVDGDDRADAEAEAALAAILRRLGFRHIAFQFEPIAAALAHEATVTREEIAVVADIGGGTSDFSVVRIGPQRRNSPDRKDDILANDGTRVGGTDFDRELSLAAAMPQLGYRAALKTKGLSVPLHFHHLLAHWPRINQLYTPEMRTALRHLVEDARDPPPLARLLAIVEDQQGHELAMRVEAAKIALSAREQAAITLATAAGPLSAVASRPILEAAIAEHLARLRAALRRCLDAAGVTASRLGSIFLTGGSGLLPAVRAAVAAEAPGVAIVDGDPFTAVGQGLAIDAARRFA